MANVILKNDVLEVSVKLPEKEPISHRFDAACVVEQVTLNGRHTFCQPEQLDPKRVTTHGIGLSSEFMDGYSEEAKAGECFPKMGVGLFKQLEDNARYDKWKDYEVIPFERSWSVDEKGISFVQEPMECRGIALRILRRVSIEANTLTISTTIQNVGSREYEGAQFQHNFLAIDDIPIGAGYRMTIPYDMEIENIMTKGERHAKNDGFRILDELGNPGELCANPVQVEGQSIVWKDSMTSPEGGKTFHKITREDGIAVLPEYKWTLSCDQSNASVSETHHFVPSNFSIWGVEHCACNEVHHKFSVKPGEVHNFSRTWTFTEA